MWHRATSEPRYSRYCTDPFFILYDLTKHLSKYTLFINAYVYQLGRGATVASTSNEGGTSSVLRTYKFYDIWPSEVSAIELSYENTDQVEEFTVTFQVQYFTIGETDDTADGDETEGT